MSSDSENAFTASPSPYDPALEDGEDYLDPDYPDDDHQNEEGGYIGGLGRAYYDDLDLLERLQAYHGDMGDDDDDDYAYGNYYDPRWGFDDDDDDEEQSSESENEPPQAQAQAHQASRQIHHHHHNPSSDDDEQDSGSDVQSVHNNNPPAASPDPIISDSDSDSDGAAIAAAAALNRGSFAASSGSALSSSSRSQAESQSSQTNPPSVESISDSEASASRESSEDQEAPPQHNRRQVSRPFDINARASPRRPSLTPDIHPNRRLPSNHAPTFAERRLRDQLRLNQEPFQRNQNPHQNRAAGQSHHHAFPVSDGTSDGDSDDDQSDDDSTSTSDPSSSDQDTHPEDNESTEDELQDNDNEDEGDDERAHLRDFDYYWDIRAVLGQRAGGRERQAGQERPGPGPGPGPGPVREDSMDLDDELVEVVYHQPAPPQNQQQRRQRPQGRQNNHHQADPPNPRQHVNVIDLTEEPDSPVLHMNRPISLPRQARPNHINLDDDDDDDYNNRHAAPHQRRNPRRQMSQSNGRTPALARSDGSILGNGPPVIDLTSDGPEEDRDNIPANRYLPLPVPQNQRGLNRRISIESFSRNFMGRFADIGRGFMPRVGLFAQLGQQAHNNNDNDDVIPIINPNPLAGNPPDFNYQANGFGGFGGARQPTPKPDFEAPPPSRPGFSRDTGNNRETDEEQIFVCPSCDNELSYSLEEEEDGQRPAKRARTKKDREEHHFWAVKACGHVYCKSCYDNRKKFRDKQAFNLGFEFIAAPSGKSFKTQCAVADCDSDVTPTAAWVGIFM